MPRSGILVAVLGFFLVLVMCATTTGIHDAAKRGDINKVKSLLEEKPEWINSENEYAQTPLHSAADGDSREIAELLIVNGADVNAKDKSGQTALMHAAMRGHTETARALLANGADVNARATGGFQIQHMSIFAPHETIAGPDLGEKIEYGWTALRLAENQKHTSIIFLLKSAGAKESNFVTYLKRGNAWLRKGDYDQAISDFNKAIELDPKYADAYFNRGYAYLKQRKWQKAVENFDQVLRLNPGHALAEQLRESALSFIQY